MDRKEHRSTKCGSVLFFELRLFVINWLALGLDDRAQGLHQLPRPIPANLEALFPQRPAHPATPQALPGLRKLCLHSPSQLQLLQAYDLAATSLPVVIRAAFDAHHPTQHCQENTWAGCEEP